MTSEAWEKAVEAMRAKRREMIAQPLDRIYGDLLRAGFEHLGAELVKHLEGMADAAASKAAGYRARASDPNDPIHSDDCLEIADGWDDEAFSHGWNAGCLRARIEQMKEQQK